MKVLVINCGSSSLKYQVLDMETETLLAKGLVERIGIEGSVIKHTRIADDLVWKDEAMLSSHKEAIAKVIMALTDAEHGVVTNMSEIDAVGHRGVHAGEYYDSSVIIDDDVIRVMEKCTELAPLHNPAVLRGINACKDLMPTTPMVAVFDTAFHQTMPPESYIYPIPYELYEKHRIRRYGFHGTSHKFVANYAAELLGKPLEEVNLITCHLGNGASLTAIKNGKVYDTSMGFTPLAGIAMGTRSGNIDPAIISFIAQKEHMTVDGVDELLNKKSGILGISGVSSDFRDVEAAAAEGNERAKLALDVYVHRVKQYLGAYLAELNGVDAIVFTAGVGENDKAMRFEICSNLENLGIEICADRNDKSGEDCVISTDSSKVKIFRIPTNEELMIARDTVEVVSNAK